MSPSILNEELLNRVLEHAAQFLRSMDHRHVGARATRQELLHALGIELPDAGEEAGAVIDALARHAERGAIASPGPRYFGFVIGGTLPVALGADWLVSAWDQNAGIFAASPVSSVLEEIAAGWLIDLLKLPDEASVGFVTGCQMANLTCLAAARHGILGKVGWNVEQEGLGLAPRIQVITSAESHVTIDVALRLLGFGAGNIVRVPTDGQGKMRPEALRALLRAGEGPVIVCAQAGNVNTGAFDPIGELAEVVHERGGWLHVDGAFGLWARASRALRPLVEGIDRADSWATDAHKWLNVPYDCGLAIVRDRSAHRASMTSSAAYLEQTTGGERDSLDWAPEFSRRARGTPVYAALRSLGRTGVEELADRCCARARQMAGLLGQAPGVQVLNEVLLNQVLIRFQAETEEGSDALTRKVIARVQREGTCWLAGSSWKGMAVMRISFSNWATSEEDVERSAHAILGALADALRHRDISS